MVFDDALVHEQEQSFISGRGNLTGEGSGGWGREVGGEGREVGKRGGKWGMGTPCPPPPSGIQGFVAYLIKDNPLKIVCGKTLGILSFYSATKKR